MQTESVQNQNEQPTRSRRLFGRLSRKATLGILGTVLLVTGMMGAATLDYLMPTPSRGASGFTGRLAWYYHHGQLRADMHTLGFVIEYVVTSDSGNWNVTKSSNPPVARNAISTASKS